MEKGSFDEAVWGCEGVFHTASPVAGTKKDPKVSTFLSQNIIALLLHNEIILLVVALVYSRLINDTAWDYYFSWHNCPYKW